MSTGSRIFAALALIAVVVAIPLLTQDAQHRPRTRRNGPTDGGDNTTLTSSRVSKTFSHQDFVGSQTCKTCHEEIYNSYLATPMGQSMATLDSVEMKKDFVNTTVSPPGNRQYKVEVKEGAMTHSEVRLNRDGEVVYEQSKPISYILGSGRRGRAYLIKEGDMLFQSPLGWYSGENKWGLSPGYSPQNHPRFSREVGDGCLYCHAGRTNAVEQDTNRYHEPIFLETSISCERCHGPGKDHVAFHSGETSEAGDDPIVNPASLEPELRDHVCNQCHLLGQSVVRKPGKTFFGFHPGQTLEDTFVMLARDEAADAGTISAVSQVEQMQASRCYQESNGRLGCTSCHDPHSTPAPEMREAYYRERCMSCHQEQGCAEDKVVREKAPANGSCIHCHMPKMPADDVPHTSLTHHGIPRSAGDMVEQEQTPDQQQGFYVFGDGEQRLSQLDVDRAKGITLMMIAWSAQSKEIATAALNHLHDAMVVGPGGLEERLTKLSDPQMLEEMAAAYFILEQSSMARICWNRLLEIRPENKSALTGLAKLAIEDKDLEKFKTLLDRLSKFEPQSEDYLLMQMQYGFFAGEPATVVEAGEALVKRNPGLVTPRRILIDAYLQLGKDDKAEEHRKFIERM